MNTELAKKCIRAGIVILIFIAMVSIDGIKDMRQTNQIVLMLAMISLFSLILRNIWVTLFLLWTVFLYSFFKFEVGSPYLSNIFFGCVLYFITKVAFKKDNIDLFINAFLWFVFANLCLMFPQATGYDFIYKKIIFIAVKEYVPNTNIDGFMGHTSTMGTLMALAIPVLASRRSRWAMAGAVGLFVPLYLSKTSLCFIAGLGGFLFILFYRIPRKVWIATVLSLILCGSFYIVKVDGPGVERFDVWKRAMNDAMIHPVTGWGLDSFANVTSYKNFRYSLFDYNIDYHRNQVGKKYEDIKRIEWWDNPHNLIVSLVFEFSIVGLFLFIAYIRQNVLRFGNAIKNPNTIGLAGFMLVFLCVSMGHFPIFLARMACFIVPAAALFEVSTS